MKTSEKLCLKNHFFTTHHFLAVVTIKVVFWLSLIVDLESSL